MIPKKTTELIPPNAEWEYLAGGQTPETETWTQLGFDAKEEGWSRGIAGFGYGDSDDRTVLKGMRGAYSSVFIRKEFEIKKGTNLRAIGLAINYDDGFSLYVNGEFVLSKSLRREEGSNLEVISHEANRPEYFPLAPFSKFFKEGQNVIAIEGHNIDLQSTDFSLDPYLLLAIRRR